MHAYRFANHYYNVMKVEPMLSRGAAPPPHPTPDFDTTNPVFLKLDCPVYNEIWHELQIQLFWPFPRLIPFGWNAPFPHACPIIILATFRRPCAGTNPRKDRSVKMFILTSKKTSGVDSGILQGGIRVLEKMGT